MICQSYEFIAGGLASAVAEIATLPMDTIKVRIQTAQPSSQLSLLHTMLFEEGFSTFFQGAEPAVIRQLLYGSLRYGLYPSVKSFIASPTVSSLMLLSPFTQRMLSGMIAGGFSSAICNPTDLIKVRMQASCNTGTRSHEYSSFLNAIRHIIYSEGFLVLYTGVLPTVVRASVLSAVELSCYETMSHFLTNYLSTKLHPALVSTIAALVAGFFSSLTTCPLDMVRSRLMCQRVKSSSAIATEPNKSYPKEKEQRKPRNRRMHKRSINNSVNKKYGLDHAKLVAEEHYAGILDCMSKIAVNGGVLALWSGFTAYYLRLGPNTVLTFLFIELFRYFVVRVFSCV